jgi:hypothetical protein
VLVVVAVENTLQEEVEAVEAVVPSKLLSEVI